VTLDPSLGDYWPDHARDRQLADLCFQAIVGRSDQRPVTPAVVTAELTEGPLQPPTLLATCSDPDSRQIVGAAALRWPHRPGGVAQLWGPVVHPNHQQQGVDARLLAYLSGVAGSAPPPSALISAGLPSTAIPAHTMFRRAGWKATHQQLLCHGAIEHHGATDYPSSVTCARDIDLDALNHHIHALHAATYPDEHPTVADDALRQWSADPRFSLAGLLLAGPIDQPVAAMLTYPVTEGPGLDELLIAEILIDPALPAADQRAAALVLTRAALIDGARNGAVFARATLTTRHTIAQRVLGEAGLATRDTTTYTAPPNAARGTRNWP
jgi:hypothetical protein